MPALVPQAQVEIRPNALKYMPDIVECHSEYEYAEKPVALTWEGQRLEIAEILARWRIPGAKCFRVETTDGQIFELFYGELDDEWRINQP